MWWTQALAVALADPGDLERADALDPQIDALYSAASYDQAETLTREQLALRESAAPDSLAVADSLHRLGILRKDHAAYAEAAELYERALEIRTRELGEEHDKISSLLNDMALNLYYQADYDGARPLAQHALDLDLKLFGAVSAPVSTDRTTLAMLDLADGNLETARDGFEDVVEIQTEIGDENLPLSIANLASVRFRLGDAAGAAAEFERATALYAEKLGPDHLEVGNTLSALGVALTSLGRFDEAEDALLNSAKIQEAALGPDHPDVAVTLNNLANLYMETWDLVRARELLVRSLEIRERAFGPEHPSVAVALNNLAGVTARLGEFEPARRLWERSLEVRRAVHGDEHPNVAVAYNNLAIAATDIGDWKRAIELHEKALAIREATLPPDHPLTAASLHALGELLRREGDYERAGVLHGRALDINRTRFGEASKQAAYSYHALSALAMDRGELDEAERLVREARAIREAVFGASSVEVAKTYQTLGDVLYAKRDYLGAHHAYELAASIHDQALWPGHTRALPMRLGRAQALAALGDVDRGRDLTSAALDDTSRWVWGMLDGVSERERMELLASQRDALDLYLSLFDRREDAGAAWDLVLRWKGVTRRAVTYQREAALLAGDERTSEKAAALTIVRRELARTALGDDPDRANAVAALTEQKEVLEREISRESAAYAEERRATEADHEQICRALPRGSALVDVLRYRREVPPDRVDAYAAFVVRAGACTDVQRVELGTGTGTVDPADTLDALVASWRERIANDRVPTDRSDDAGARLRAALWDPLLPALGDSDPVIFVPDGALSAVSLGALPVGDGYLVEERTVGYLENAADWVRAGGTREPTEQTLLIGSIDYGAEVAALEAHTRSAPCLDEDFAPLPGTTAELDALAVRLDERGVGTIRLEGASATESAVRDAMPGSRIVHFATHGFFSTGRCASALDARGAGYNPMLLSGMALAGANHDALSSEDGLFTAEEVSTIDLNGTEVVVLSACDTGLGEAKSGEGVLGLRRAFALAGARSLVMSLWEVDDNATTTLMSSMYDELLRRRPRATLEALTRAQRAALERNRRELGDARPGTWGAFIASGTSR